MRAAGGSSRTGTESRARLTTQWETPKLNVYDKQNADDFFTCLPADFKASGKPLLIYVASDNPDAAKETSALEDYVLKDENIAVGARLFRAIRVKGDRLTKEHAHWQTLGGKALPRLIVVGNDGQKIGKLEDKELSSSNLFKTMTKAATRVYKTDLEKVVKETRALLDDMDQIEAKQKVLAEQKKNAKPGKEQEITAEEAKLAGQLKVVKQREADLLKKVTEDRKVTKG